MVFTIIGCNSHLVCDTSYYIYKKKKIRTQPSPYNGKPHSGCEKDGECDIKDSSSNNCIYGDSDLFTVQLVNQYPSDSSCLKA